jgi:hypothetical protein
LLDVVDAITTSPGISSGSGIGEATLARWYDGSAGTF